MRVCLAVVVAVVVVVVVVIESLVRLALYSHL